MQRNTKTISGTVERITYQNPDNGYTIARLAPEREGRLPGIDDGLVTVVGTLPVSAGEAVEIEGFWRNHPKHGWQLSVVSYRTVLPATEAGIRRYLGSGMIKGIGPVTARKIVDHFALDTLSVLEEAPERLTEIRDIGRKKAGMVARGWAEQKAVRDVMIALSGFGVSTSLGVRIYRKFGDDAADVVRKQPYRLARDVWGIGFRTADRIAQQTGISPDDPERAKAGVLFALGEAAEKDGHTYLPRSMLTDRAAELLEVDASVAERAIDSLVLEESLRMETVRESEAGVRYFAPVTRVQVFEPPGAGGKEDEDNNAERVEAFEGSTPTLSASPGERAVWLPVYYASERSIASSAGRLGDVPSAEDKLSDMRRITAASLIEWMRKHGKVELTNEQAEGVVRAIRSPVSIITGGPGVGKTMTQRALVRMAELAHKKVVLAAPTGKAAKRMSEVTGAEAKTLHRLLGIQPGGTPLYNLDNPLPADLVIADEVSMLDTLLAHQLLRAVGRGTHLLLVGDSDQLPSVGAGNVLSDLIASGRVPVTRLTQVFRQREGSALIENAHKVNRGVMPHWGKEVTDFFVFREDEPEAAGELTVELVSRRIPRKFGVKPSDIQVLSPMRSGRCGTIFLNESLQGALNPPTPGRAEYGYGNRVYRIGDRVIQLRNNYDKEVFNGDGGRITWLVRETQQLGVALDDGREVTYEFSELDELAHAFALTVHKAQGSEFPVVVIPLAMGHYTLLERRLIYTAMTRAKQLVVLVGSVKALAIAVKRGPDMGEAKGRYTGLAMRLTERVTAPVQPDAWQHVQSGYDAL